MAEIIFCGTPKQASTVQKRVRSMESYALVRSIKHTGIYSGIRFFRANSCSRRITNAVEEARRLVTPALYVGTGTGNGNVNVNHTAVFDNVWLALHEFCFQTLHVGEAPPPLALLYGMNPCKAVRAGVALHR